MSHILRADGRRATDLKSIVIEYNRWREGLGAARKFFSPKQPNIDDLLFWAKEHGHKPTLLKETTKLLPRYAKWRNTLSPLKAAFVPEHPKPSEIMLWAKLQGHPIAESEIEKIEWVIKRSR